MEKQVGSGTSSALHTFGEWELTVTPHQPSDPAAGPSMPAIDVMTLVLSAAGAALLVVGLMALLR